MRDRITESGKYEVIEESFFRKILREVGWGAKPVSRLDEAVAVARRLGVDTVVFGEVPEFTWSEQKAVLRLELRMADRVSGEASFARSYSETLGGGTGPGTWRARLADSSKARRVFIWAVFALLLPILASPLIRRLAAEDSNTVNLLMLGGLTAIDVIAAAALASFWLATWWTIAALLAAACLAGYYNFRVTTVIDELSR
jgi:hypothetical protein